LTLEEISFACAAVKYISSFLLSSFCDLINDREAKSRPRDMPAAKAIIMNVFLEQSIIKFRLPGRNVT